MGISLLRGSKFYTATASTALALLAFFASSTGRTQYYNDSAYRSESPYSLNSPYKDDGVLDCALLLAPETAREGDEFRDQLHREVAASHRALSSYSTAQMALFNDYNLQPRSGDQLLDVYCNETYKVAGGNLRGRINVEHTWPQSKFSREFSKTTQKTDLHHLFLSSITANSARGNHEFGEVIRETNGNICDDSQAGYNDKGYDVFEPPEQHKGVVARALFYFAVRYKLQISKSQEMVLRQWHKDHPVTDIERARNSRIENIQGNRNPFIDHPEYVGMIADF